MASFTIIETLVPPFIKVDFEKQEALALEELLLIR